jgi:hypothetical protein
MPFESIENSKKKLFDPVRNITGTHGAPFVMQKSVVLE